MPISALAPVTLAMCTSNPASAPALRQQPAVVPSPEQWAPGRPRHGREASGCRAGTCPRPRPFQGHPARLRRHSSGHIPPNKASVPHSGGQPHLESLGPPGTVSFTSEPETPGGRDRCGSGLHAQDWPPCSAHRALHLEHTHETLSKERRKKGGRGVEEDGEGRKGRRREEERKERPAFQS